MQSQLKYATKHPAKKSTLPVLKAAAESVEIPPVAAATNNPLKFTVENAMLAIERLRITASDHHQQFVVQGRKAMLDLIAKIYQQFYDAKSSSEFESFMNNVRSKLTTHGVTLRTNSTNGSSVVRLVFKDFDDKQVSVYGHAINLAYKRNIDPDGFQKFVEENGGFEGLRKISLDEAVVVRGPDKVSIALSVIENEQTVHTMNAAGWSADEKYRVYIALFNDDDGVVDLKDSRLTKEHLDATLILAKSDKDRRDNPPKPKKIPESVTDKAVLLQFETLLKSQQIKQAELKLQFKAAVDSGDLELSNELAKSLGTAIGVAEGYERAIADLGTKLKMQSK